MPCWAGATPPPPQPSPHTFRPAPQCARALLLWAFRQTKSAIEVPKALQRAGSLKNYSARPFYKPLRRSAPRHHYRPLHLSAPAHPLRPLCVSAPKTYQRMLFRILRRTYPNIVFQTLISATNLSWDFFPMHEFCRITIPRLLPKAQILPATYPGFLSDLSPDRPLKHQFCRLLIQGFDRFHLSL